MPEHSLQAGQVERTAFYLDSGGHALFAWLHAAAGTVGAHGVVICPPLGHEQVHSHRTLRHLADRLAARGFAVLRPDYLGTGDSDGTEEDPHRLATWLVNVNDAAEWLRNTAGCQKISLVGLRMGAALAVLHAQHHEVENLVLWSPIVKGRRYVRELTALSQTAQLAAGSSSNCVEAMGFVYTRETLDALAKIDLLSGGVHCRNVLIASHTSAGGDSALLEHLCQQGMVAEQKVLPGYEGMMAEPHDTVVPQEALQDIEEWMVSKAPPSAPGRRAAPSPGMISMQVSSPAALREFPLRISRAPDLFGIMTEPVEFSDSLPWIVMLNAGAAYRIGPGRLHVQLARQLAALGYPCLRFDLNGLGDSVLAEQGKENDAYAATAFRDVAAVCDFLHAREPGRPIVLMGLCSGAYVAFQSAVQLRHPAIIESVLINPLVFFWREGMIINDTNTEQLVAWREYWRSIFKWSQWKMLLTGKTRTGFAGSVKRFASHLLPRLPKPGRLDAPSAEAAPQCDYGHPPRKDLPGDLQRVAAAARRLVMFVSDNDPGHFLLMYQARRKATQLMKQGSLQCFFVPEADHTFSTAQARQTFSRSLLEYLQGRFETAPSQERNLEGKRATLSPALTP
ncbi:alpha/beta fold hydrolase [Prosthecobacter sp.]|uniref:alpha/beta fold hydrolase n=1 Tax=Prosthecobacter sp. TaxID=1965333 RepID=UPI003784E6C1